MEKPTEQEVMARAAMLVGMRLSKAKEKLAALDANGPKRPEYDKGYLQAFEEIIELLEAEAGMEPAATTRQRIEDRLDELHQRDVAKTP